MSARADSLASPRIRSFSRATEWWVLWLFALGGGIVLIEPSPYELGFLLALLVLLVGGMRLGPAGLFMTVLLALFNIGGLFALVPFLHDGDAVMFIAISFYLAVTATFFAALVQNDAAYRLHALKWGLVCGAMIASCAGILGYFDIAGLGSLFTLHGRASGTFKDPNVLGTFVILPLVLLAQAILVSGRLRFRFVVPFVIILFGGVFLSFSRGAWGHAFISLALMGGLTFLIVTDGRVRQRIILVTIAGFVVLLAGLAALLAIEDVRAMFEMRASLVQDYDVGATGRFGRFGRAIPELLQMPNGYGPLQFRHVWIEDPHNVFINAFASYGWFGGIAYLGLVLATLVIGWKTVAMRSPVQLYAIAVWSVLFVQILQGMTIDTDHWRHFYLLLGLSWGLFDLARRYQMDISGK